MARGKKTVKRPKQKAKPSLTNAELTHIDARGQARMVDVSAKNATERLAVAEGKVVMRKETLDLVLAGNAMKGDVLGAARLAGIMAAKRTHGLIPLCHPLPITKVEIDINPEHSLPGFLVQATVKVTGQTGVEMEALTASDVSNVRRSRLLMPMSRDLSLSARVSSTSLCTSTSTSMPLAMAVSSIAIAAASSSAAMMIRMQSAPSARDSTTW